MKFVELMLVIKATPKLRNFDNGLGEVRGVGLTRIF